MTNKPDNTKTWPDAYTTIPTEEYKTLQSALAAEREKVRILELGKVLDGMPDWEAMYKEEREKMENSLKLIKRLNEDLLVDFQRANQAEASCAHMRRVMQYIHDLSLSPKVLNLNSMDDKIDECLASSCGIGWASPEEVGRLLKAIQWTLDAIEIDRDMPHPLTASEIKLKEALSSFKQSQQAK